jgi:hypothetical protein
MSPSSVYLLLHDAHQYAFLSKPPELLTSMPYQHPKVDIPVPGLDKPPFRSILEKELA